MTGRQRTTALLVLAILGCDTTNPPFVPNMRYEPVVTVGGVDEDNELFQFGWPWIWLADSTTVVYSDERAPGRLVVAEVLGGQGWLVDDSLGGEGPGEFGRYTPFVSTVSDTIKLLTPVGRLSARSLLNGAVLYDSLLMKQDPGQVWAGIARNARVTIHAQLEVGGEISLRVESPRAYHTIPIGSVEIDEQAQGSLGVTGAARGDLIAYTLNSVVHTRNGIGEPIASRALPWKVASLSIDGDERIWAQVFGDAPGGYNLVIMNPELDVVGYAVVPGFRDANGAYVISVSRGEFDVPLLTLLRLSGS